MVVNVDIIVVFITFVELRPSSIYDMRLLLIFCRLHVDNANTCMIFIHYDFIVDPLILQSQS